MRSLLGHIREWGCGTSRDAQVSHKPLWRTQISFCVGPLSLQDDFAAIVLDVRMPDMDRLRNGRNDSQPSIETGTHTRPHGISERGGTCSRGYDLGPVDFLLRPIMPEALHSKVAALVELSRVNANLKVQTAALRHQAEVLQKAEKKFRSLLEAAPDALIVTNRDGDSAQRSTREPIWLRSG